MLARLFARIDPTYFHPHPLTPEEAARIEAYDGPDVYLWTEHAYGFLRGWEEGYEVPSLGIAVATDAQGQGHGRAMMLRLHEAARARGAERIRLRVHPGNQRARRLYDSLGYVESGMDRGEVLMLCRVHAVQGGDGADLPVPRTGRQRDTGDGGRRAPQE